VNRAWVLNLYDVLRELGHEVFLDQVALKAGDALTGTLQKALGASQAGVLIWSTHTADSEWVQREYEVMEGLTSDKKGFSFVPIRLDRSPLPLMIRRRVFLDFADYPDGPNGGELLRLLHAIAGKALSLEAARFAVTQDEAAKEALNKINGAIRNGNERRLCELFEQDGLPWCVSAALGCKAAEGLTRLGHHDLAIGMLERLEGQFPKAIRPKQLRALALARRAVSTKLSQDLDTAQEILGALYESGERDPETLGIYGRTWMDRHELKKERLALRRSRDLYAEAFEAARDDYYTGINAAAKSVLLDTPQDLAQAAAYAAQVLEIVGSRRTPGDYWRTATSAEALLIGKDYRQAGELYQAAVDMAPAEIGSHESTWGQARRLMEKLGSNEEERLLVARAFSHLAGT
jgi:tetratricopeptide (TPR) repeat protein